MQNRALVKKTYGDSETCGAIVDGIAREVIPLNSRELDIVKMNYRCMKAREGVRHPKSADEQWENTKRRMAIQYGVKQHGRVYKALLLGYAVAYLVVRACFVRLWAAAVGKGYTGKL